MNAQLLNPFARTVPERVEATLENAYANCFAFSAGKGVLAGSYIAVGRTDGIVSVWDLETRNVLCWMGEHVKTVTSVSWSPYGRYLASSSLDWNVHIWDLANNVYRRARTLRFDCSVSQVNFSPQTSRLLAVVVESRQALLAQFPTPGQFDPEQGTEPQIIPLGDTLEDGTTSVPATTCCFSPDGAFLLVGTSKGFIHVFDVHTGKENGAPVSIGSSSVRQLAFDAAGRCVVVNLNDRTLRTYLVLRDDQQMSFLLSPQHKFQDLVSRTPWSGVSFSGDSDYVMGGAAQATAHNVYVWDRESGVLFKILEGPREPLVSAQWHPSKPMLASIASTGDIYLWSAPSTEVWSAYAPGFEELEENVEYDEPEDEFDFEDVDALSRKKQDEEEGFVDIFSMGPESYTAAAKSTAPPIVRRHASNLAPATDTQDTSITEDRLRDDDDQPAFFIPPVLEELEEQP